MNGDVMPGKKPAKKKRNIPELKEWPKPTPEQIRVQKELTKIEEKAKDWGDRLFKTLDTRVKYEKKLSKEEIEAMKHEEKVLEKKRSLNSARKIVLDLNEDLAGRHMFNTIKDIKKIISDPNVSESHPVVKFLIHLHFKLNYLLRSLPREDIEKVVNKWGNEHTKQVWRFFVGKKRRITDKEFKEIGERLREIQEKGRYEILRDLAVIRLVAEYHIFPQEVFHWELMKSGNKSLTKEYRKLLGHIYKEVPLKEKKPRK